MRIDFTLTLPGMLDLANIQALAQELGVEILAKVVFAFTPEIVLSPMALPRNLLDPWVDQLLTQVQPGALHDVLAQLKHRPTFAEQWPDTYAKGLAAGRQRMLQLESRRPCATTMDSILAARPQILEWWNSIA